MPEISERVGLAACVEYFEQPKAKEKSIWSEKVVIVIQKRNAGQLLARERAVARPQRVRTHWFMRAIIFSIY